jgi:hypothetical protein
MRTNKAELFGFLPIFPHYKTFFEKEQQFLGERK